MHLPHDAVVLVADGRKLLFLRNRGDGEYPDLTVDTAEEQDDPPTRDQGTDRPGRSHSSVGAGRSAHSETDWHQLEEDRFAADAAALLKQRALANDYDKLVVIAPPKTLGELRKHYHAEVSDRLIGELDKDLTGHPISDIEAAIGKA